MTCSVCGAPRLLNDRVCPRCKYFFEENRFIDVHPPRASDPPKKADRQRSFRRISKPLISRATSPLVRIQNYLIYLVALVPGLGHVLSGVERRGIVFFGIVCISMAVSIVLFSSGIGQLLFGLAVSAHAYSIFDLTPWKRDSKVAHRVVALSVILGFLLLIYWPLVTYLSQRFLPPVWVPRGRRMAGPSDAEQIMLIVFIAIVLLCVSILVSRLLSSRGNKHDSEHNNSWFRKRRVLSSQSDKERF